MRHAILWITLLLVPLIGGTTAHAFFDISGPIQRAIMIANQVTQIGHAVTSLASLREQFGKLKEQYEHIRAQTLGEVGQLTETLTDLSSLPGQLVGTRLTWRDDFTDPTTAGLVDALDLFSNDGTPLTGHWRDRMTEADTVTEHDVLRQYMDLPTRLANQAAANYRHRHEQGAQRTVMNYAMNDAAAGAAGAVKSALDSYARLRAQTNTSPTALQQAQVAGLLTSGEVSAALAQLHAFEAAKDAADALAAEQRRRELEAARLDAQRRGQATYRRRVAGIAASRDGGESLKLRMTALYGG